MDLAVSRGLKCSFLLCILITGINSITRHEEVELRRHGDNDNLINSKEYNSISGKWKNGCEWEKVDLREWKEFAI